MPAIRTAEVRAFQEIDGSGVALLAEKQLANFGGGNYLSSSGLCPATEATQMTLVTCSISKCG